MRTIEPKRRLKRPLRQKRFRQYLLSEAELRSESHVQALHPAMAALYWQWRAGELTEVEVVGHYILNFLRVYRPRDYRGGPHKKNLFDCAIPSDLSAASQVDSSLPEIVQTFASTSLRSVPLSVNRALVGWALKRYPLRLVDYIPTAEELLDRQASGERIVTCLFQPHELTSWVNGSRDPLGFVLHDLIHADHFFRDSAMCAGQVEFYREVQGKLQRGEFADLLSEPRRRARFEYIIADMNSHPAHLRACLEREVTRCQLPPKKWDEVHP